MREFEVRIEQSQLDDMQRRLEATRWLEGNLTDAPDYGATLGFVRQHCDYWRDSFDWRALEARINSQPNFLASINGLDIHFIHRRSSSKDAIPIILMHGWPTSFLEFLEICDALAEPAEGKPAFHVVVPSLPGYGFSETRPGTSPRRIAHIFAELMAKLGYERYLIQGGNWGSGIGTEMAREWPARVIGLHLNSINGTAPPSNPALSPDDEALADTYRTLLSAPHFNLVAQSPLSIAHALNDSPAGTLAWHGQWLQAWADAELADNPGLVSEWIVGNSALYWLTGTAASAAMLYREAVQDPAPERFVTVPTAVAHFVKELVVIPRPWAEHHYNIARWTKIDRGGHYPAIEVPDLFIEDVRTFAAELCQSGEAG